MNGADPPGAGEGGLGEIRLRGRRPAGQSPGAPAERRRGSGGSGQGSGTRGQGPGTRGKGLRLLAGGLIFLLILAAAFALLERLRGGSGGSSGSAGGRPRARETAGGADSAPYGPATRAVTLYFLDERGEVIPEAREVAVKATLSAQIEAVVAEELLGSMAERASPVPPGTELLHVFVGGNGLVTLDLSREIVRDHPGGMEQEYATLAALVRAVSTNFPALTAVQILIEGKPEPTLAGHFAIEGPLSAEDWL